MSKFYTFITVLMIVSCGDSSKSGFAGAPNPSLNTPSEPGSEETSFSCPDSWAQEGDSWLDPVDCLAWAPLSDDNHTWHEAISPNEAINGGCSNNCDEDAENNYCTNLDLDGRSWRLPSVSQLERLADRDLPFFDLEFSLWTMESASPESLAWTLDLSQPGAQMAQDKGNPQRVRCTAY